MDLTLLAILGTAVCALLLSAAWNAGAPGPAGRRSAIPRYQRRVLSCLAVLMVCVVVLTYLVARTPAPGGGPVDGPTLLELLGPAAALGTWSVLRRDAAPRSAALAAGGLALLAFSLTAVAFARLTSWTHPDAAAFLARARAALDLSSPRLFALMLVHYGLTAWLAALALTRWTEEDRRPAWDGDGAFRATALASMAWAGGAALFTLGVVF